MELIKFIDGVNKRPAMFGVNNVKELSLLINGFIYGLQVNNYKGRDLELFQNQFREIVRAKVMMDNESYSWDGMILFHSASYLHSIELFKECYEVFKLRVNG